MSPTLRLVGPLLCLVMMTPACGGDTPEADPGEDELVQEIADAFFRSTDPPEGVAPGLFTEGDARCWAEALVAAVDRDTLRGAGFGSGEGAEATMPDVSLLLNEETAVVYVEAATHCLDFAKFIASDMTQEGAPEDFARCVAEQLVAADGFVDWMAASFFVDTTESGADSQMPGFMLDAMLACADLQG